MAETFEQEVERRLLALKDPRKSVVFASRVALLALSDLTVQQLQEWCTRPWFQQWLLATQRAIFCSESRLLLDGQAKVLPVDVASAAGAAVAAANTAIKDDPAFGIGMFAATAAFVAGDAIFYTAEATMAAAARAAFSGGVIGHEAIIRSMMTSLEQPDTTVAAFLAQSLPLQLTTLIKFQRSPACGQGFEFWADWLEMRVAGELPSSELAEQVLMLSKEVLAMEPAHINEHLLALRSGFSAYGRAELPITTEGYGYSGVKVNSVRCMIVGFGYVGKTSLSRVLQGKPVEPEQPMTDGFDIQPWTPESAPELDVRLWDFAGQAMAHSCHRLFFTARCVYVIVVAAAGRQQEERLDGLLRSPTDQAEYWFEAIRPYAWEEGRKVPVLLLANKDDAGRVDLDMPHLQRRFGTDFEFDQPYYLSLQQPDKYSTALQGFKDELEQRLLVVNQWQTPLSPAQHEVYRWVCDQSRTLTWLRMADFIKQCDDRNISKEFKSGERSQSFLLSLLSMLGVILDFSQESKNNLLKDQLLLQPQWLSQAITYLIRGARSQLPVTARKCLTLDEMESLIAAESGKSDFCTSVQCYGVIDAMVKAGLAYPHGDGWVIPEALADQEPPDETKFPADALTCHFAFPYAVPGQIFSQLMCKLHAEVEDGKVWRRGMVLRDSSGTYLARALMRVDYGLRRITLLVCGADAGRYFTDLLRTTRNVLNGKKNSGDGEVRSALIYSELLGLPDNPNEPPADEDRIKDAERVVDLQDIEQIRRFGQGSYYGKFGRFELAEILKDMTVKGSGSGGTTINVNGDVGVLNAPAGNHVGDIYNHSAVTNDLRQQVILHLSQLETQLSTLADSAFESVNEQPVDAMVVMQAVQPAQKAIKILRSETSTPAEQQEAQGKLAQLWDTLRDTGSGLASSMDAITKVDNGVKTLTAVLAVAVPAIAKLFGL